MAFQSDITKQGAAALGSLSGSILTQAIGKANERGVVVNTNHYILSMFDSVTGTKWRIGADVEDRIGFATREEAEARLAAVFGGRA